MVVGSPREANDAASTPRLSLQGSPSVPTCFPSLNVEAPNDELAPFLPINQN